MWQKKAGILFVRTICLTVHFCFIFSFLAQWNMIKSSYQCGGITESSGSTYRGSRRGRRSPLRSFEYIKTSSTNVSIMRPFASASTRCWRSTLTGEQGYVVMCLLVHNVHSTGRICPCCWAMNSVEIISSLITHSSIRPFFYRLSGSGGGVPDVPLTCHAFLLLLQDTQAFPG